jgi:uncharacterized Zn finger protein
VTAADKARALLADGHVQILSADESHVAARVRGSTGIYDTAWYFGQWTCTCAAYGRCSHELAVELVTLRPVGRPTESISA